MTDYILAAVRQQHPTASVDTFTFDGGQTFTVRADGRTVRVSAYWGDNPETVAARIVDGLGKSEKMTAKASRGDR